MVRKSGVKLRDYAALDRRVWLLAAARAANTMGLSLVMAFMAVYLVSERGLSGTTTGVIYAVANILQAIAQVYAGELSDRAGRKRTMVLALVGRALLVAGLGVVVLAESPVWVIVILLNVSWFVRGWFEPVAYAAVADVAAPEEHVAAFGLQKIGVNVGWAAGPALGGFLMAHIGFGWVFFCSAPIILVTAIAVSLMREPPRSGAPARASVIDALREVRGNRLAGLFLTCGILSGLVHAQLFSTFSVYVSDGLALPESQLGLLWTINGIIVTGLQIPIIRVISHYGMHASQVIGASLFLAAFLGAAQATGFGVLAASIAVWSIGEIIHDPAQQGTAAALAKNRRMGRAMGLLGMARTTGGAFSMLVGGAAFDAFRDHPQAMWLALAVLPALLTAGYALLVAFRNKTETRAA